MPWGCGPASGRQDGLPGKARLPGTTGRVSPSGKAGESDWRRQSLSQERRPGLAEPKAAGGRASEDAPAAPQPNTSCCAGGPSLLIPVLKRLGGKKANNSGDDWSTAPAVAGAQQPKTSNFLHERRCSTNRLILSLKVILGITLILNLAVCESVFGVGGANPPPPSGPCDTPECYWSMQQEVFGYLFDIDLTEEDPWAYRVLDDNDAYIPMTGTGPYSGRIHTDQTFTFDCTTYLPVPLDFSVLPPEQQPTPEQVQKTIDENWQIACIAGRLATAGGEVPIIGIAVCATPVELGTFVSYFVVLGVLPADDPFIIGLAPPSEMKSCPRPPPWVLATTRISRRTSALRPRRPARTKPIPTIPAPPATLLTTPRSPRRTLQERALIRVPKTPTTMQSNQLTRRAIMP